MNRDEAYYDVAIAGGGLAGLALSIQLAKAGHRVILFEKEQYPFHKVCGEYISLESRDFLVSLGIDIDGMDLPLITKLVVSAPNGSSLKQRLPLGGFGVSRYQLDHQLAALAKEAGVQLMENTKVDDIIFADEEGFIIHTSAQQYRSRVACAAFGKRSNMDVKWKRKFAGAAKNKLNNYIGVKYHIRGNFEPDTISLHNFQNGYCGISRIENGEYNLCYLTTADNLKKCKGDIGKMEQTILSSNPHLKIIFHQSQFISKTPLTISQISFSKKSQAESHILMVGDAAGMITPLCGNGMSMALHSSKMAATQICAYLKGEITRIEMEQQYCTQWKKQFSRRLKIGRSVQRFFGRNRMTIIFIRLMKIFPGLAYQLIRRTHGKPF